MPETDERVSISEPLEDVIPSPEITTLPDALSSDARAALKRRSESWQKVLDDRLIEWGREPGSLADEGVDPPTPSTIRRAILLAQRCRDEGLAPPDRVVIDPNGGIVFERREGELHEVIHVWEDGPAEYLGFRGTSLIERRIIESHGPTIDR